MTVRTAHVESRRTAVLAEVIEIYGRLTDPNGRALNESNRQMAAGIGPAAACYALPEFARDLGSAGVPLLWTWPAESWAAGDRRNELLLAAALALAAILEHTPPVGTSDRPRLSVVRDSKVPEVDQNSRRSADHRIDRATAAVERVRAKLVDVDGEDPSCSLRPMAVERLALAAACYLLPAELRAGSRTGVPQMWAWPDATWIEHADREGELLIGAAMVLATIELLDLTDNYRARSVSLAVINGGVFDR